MAGSRNRPERKMGRTVRPVAEACYGLLRIALCQEFHWYSVTDLPGFAGDFHKNLRLLMDISEKPAILLRHHWFHRQSGLIHLLDDPGILHRRLENHLERFDDRIQKYSIFSEEIQHPTDSLMKLPSLT